ncbi:winged helix DNA-binding domain-containing protein [Spongisporangium articulatum]|uniref:Winged helix DNA-binding domain-containing protein n=1 Tax=Spongisporangium articulatum TaxID=3362603 RepID=A0ABW8AHJ8_9ACTN
MALTWEQVLAWRTERQFLTRLDGADATAVARRLAGLQAQVPTSAALQVAVRQATPDLQAAAAGLADRSLIRTWVMRGTLHLLPTVVAPAYLSLLAHARSWHKGSWQKTFVRVDQVDTLAAAVTDALAGGAALTRDELVAHVQESTGDADLVEHLASGWGTILKPLAWQGILCNGPSDGGRVTFTAPRTWSPAWTGLPAPGDAAPVVIDAYLGAYGPASPESFDQWLIRGVTPKKALRGWFSRLQDAGTLVEVDVEGQRLLARAHDVDALQAARPHGTVRLLPGFDPTVLGPGTSDPHVVPVDHRADVSLAGGWIAPTVLRDGAVVGTWTLGPLGVRPFAPFNKADKAALRAETDRVAAIIG